MFALSVNFNNYTLSIIVLFRCVSQILELEQKELDLISQHSTVEGLLKQQLQDASETHTVHHFRLFRFLLNNSISRFFEQMDCAKIAELETSVSNLNTQLGFA
jgi:hypothetical protein